MASIFRQDNPFNDFMSTVGDMAMISIAWTICSIPVVTVGASTAAACEVARELQSGSCKGIFRSFWAAFKRRFPTTLALTAVIAAFCGLALFDLWYLSRQSTDTVAVLYGVTIVVIAVVPTIIFYFTGNTLIQAFGGTSILIMIGVALDTMSKVESQLKMHNYEGFFK